MQPPALPRLLRRPPLVVVLLGIVVAIISCNVRTIEVRPLTTPPPDSVVSVTTPVKAHLLDGTSVYFPQGVALQSGTIFGSGTRYGLRLESLGTVSAIPLDSVAGMEVYAGGTNNTSSFAMTVLATGGVLVLGAALAVAIFGSCPTFYSDSANSWRLEAEGFSYSIAAMYEARDIDRLRATTLADGTLRLEVRNEALETHFINQLELLQVGHAADEMVLPDPRGVPVAVRGALPLLGATDRFGADLRPALATADGDATASDARALVMTSADALDDQIDVTVPIPAGTDSVAVVFRLRNSLLNTVLLYDEMLAGQGLKALEWQSTALTSLLPALQVAEWYKTNMGLRISRLDGETWRPIDRIPDTGPIAWKDVAVVVAAPRAATMRLRLASVVDNWRIDRITVGAVRRPTLETLPIATLLGADDRPDTAALHAVAADDARYLQTTPGQRFTAIWQPRPNAPGEEATFLLASQGYYTEWMRPEWLAQSAGSKRFRPDKATLLSAVRRWSAARDSLELAFYNSRLPVR